MFTEVANGSENCELPIFLKIFEVSFERRAILVLRFESGLQLLHQKFEPEDFVA